MIELCGLCKRFGTTLAVDHLSLRVDSGEVLGFIGPNGAGKTTTIRMLATLLRPDEGSAIVEGLDVVREREQVRSCLGYMPDFFGLYDQMRVWEYLDFFASAYKVPRARRRGLVGDVLELVDLGDKREAYVETLSRGMKQRLCLAMALVHDPQVLLLDEPASGLDPRARVEMRELLQELCAMDKTIIISSHILTELAELCTKVAIIERGKLVMAGTVADIARRLQPGRRLLIRLADRQQECCDFLNGCAQVADAEATNGIVKALFQGDNGGQRDLLARLIASGFPVETFAEEETDLEDLYMQVIRAGESA